MGTFQLVCCAGEANMTETVSITPEDATGTPFPPVRRCPVAAPEEYGQLREEGPLVKVTTVGGETVWWATTQPAARAILADARFSSDRKRDGFPIFVADKRFR